MLRQLFEEAARDGAPQVVFNMADVPYLDSAGLGSLVNGLKQLQERGGDLRLAALQDRVRDLLEVTHLNRALKAFNAEAEAAASFATPAQRE